MADAPPTGTSRLGRGARGRFISLVPLAVAQRRLLWAILGIYLLPVAFVGAAFLSATSRPMGELAMGACSLAGVGLAVTTVVLVARMAIAYGVHPVLGVLGGVLVATPCLGYILLALLNGHVVATLRLAGVRVGLMGVGPAELNKLKLGVCRGCGYDLRGVPGPVCPECGAARAGAVTR